MTYSAVLSPSAKASSSLRRVFLALDGLLGLLSASFGYSKAIPTTLIKLFLGSPLHTCATLGVSLRTRFFFFFASLPPSVVA